MRVILPPDLLKSGLVLQEPGALHEKNREGAEPRIDQPGPGVLARALVDEALESSAQLLGDVPKGQNEGPRGHSSGGFQ